MNIGSICAITFGDVVGTFVIGILLGVCLTVLVCRWAFRTLGKDETP